MFSLFRPVLAVALASLFLMSAAPAHVGAARPTHAGTAASTDTVPLLTGGILTQTGTAQADWARDEHNGNYATEHAHLGPWTSSALLSIAYPNVPRPYPYPGPTDVHGNPLDMTFPTEIGTADAKLTNSDGTSNCHFTIPGDQPYFDFGVQTQPDTDLGYFMPFRNESPQTSCTYRDAADGLTEPALSALISHVIGGGLHWVLPQALPPKTTITKTVTYSGQDDSSCTDCAVNTASVKATFRLACMLCVSHIAFKQLANPSASGDDLADVPDSGTYDGNQVEVDATIQNNGPKSVSVPVSFVDAGTNTALPEAANTKLVQPVAFPAGKSTVVKFTWDTSGFAWYKGDPQTLHRIDVLTPYGGATRQIKVLPRPVVLVHGWSADASTWNQEKRNLEAINPDWKGYAVGDNPAWGAAMDTDPQTGASIETNAFAQAKYIESLRKKLGAQHVDVVAHSMGGLISRAYIDHIMTKTTQPPDTLPIVTHLIMLGTPNLGSICAYPLSTLLGKWDSAVPTLQLRPDFVTNVFDKQVTQQHGVQFSVEAGYGYSVCGDALPGTSGDLVVDVKSAWANYTDVDKIHDPHTCVGIIGLSRCLPNDAAIVANFIKPRLALDPSQVSHAIIGRRATVRRQTTSAAPSALDAPLAAAKRFTLKPKASSSVALKVTDGTLLFATISAPPSVGAKFMSPTGKAQAFIAPNSLASSEPMQSLAVSKPAHGTWKLVLTNAGSVKASVMAGAGISGSATTLTPAAKALKNGAIAVKAILLHGKKAIPGAKVVADVPAAKGKMKPLPLFDDGKHGDGKAGDGIFSVTVKSLPPGTTAVNLTATWKGGERIATAVLSP